MLTLKQMRYFDALAIAGHFGRAAELVNVSQPALSAQIAEMERELNLTLAERSRGQPILTREGEALLPKIRAILASVDQLYQDAQSATGVLEGRLRLGIIPTVAPYLVPVLIPVLRDRFPKLNVELKELMTQACLDEVRAGRLDCAIIALPRERHGLSSRHLFEDRFMIASADDDSTVLLSPVTEADVDMERLLLLEEGHCLRDQALAVCGANAGRRVANYGATSMATLLQMVSHGMGITLIPEIAVRDERSRNRMRIIPFADPQPSRQIGMVWRDTNTTANRDMTAFADVIVESAQPLLNAA